MHSEGGLVHRRASLQISQPDTHEYLILFQAYADFRPILLLIFSSTENQVARMHSNFPPLSLFLPDPPIIVSSNPLTEKCHRPQPAPHTPPEQCIPYSPPSPRQYSHNSAD